MRGTKAAWLYATVLLAGSLVVGLVLYLTTPAYQQGNFWAGTTQPQISPSRSATSGPVLPSATPSASAYQTVAPVAHTGYPTPATRAGAADAFEQIYAHFYDYPKGLGEQADRILPGILDGNVTALDGLTPQQAHVIRGQLENLDPYLTYLEVGSHTDTEIVNMYWQVISFTASKPVQDVQFTVDAKQVRLTDFSASAPSAAIKIYLHGSLYADGAQSGSAIIPGGMHAIRGTDGWLITNLLNLQKQY